MEELLGQSAPNRRIKLEIWSSHLKKGSRRRSYNPQKLNNEHRLEKVYKMNVQIGDFPSDVSIPSANSCRIPCSTFEHVPEGYVAARGVVQVVSPTF